LAASFLLYTYSPVPSFVIIFLVVCIFLSLEAYPERSRVALIVLVLSSFFFAVYSMFGSESNIHGKEEGGRIGRNQVFSGVSLSR
jgi:uncharacterized membrane protein YadS